MKGSQETLAKVWRSRNRIDEIETKPEIKQQRNVFIKGIVCKVRTQDPENFDEEVKSLATAWCRNCNGKEL